MTTPSPDDAEVVDTASAAATDLIFSHYAQSAVRDLDVTVTFQSGVLDVDVYLNVPDSADGPNPETVADEAALAAQAAVDDLFETV